MKLGSVRVVLFLFVLSLAHPLWAPPARPAGKPAGGKSGRGQSGSGSNRGGSTTSGGWPGRGNPGGASRGSTARTLAGIAATLGTMRVVNGQVVMEPAAEALRKLIEEPDKLTPAEVETLNRLTHDYRLGAEQRQTLRGELLKVHPRAAATPSRAPTFHETYVPASHVAHAASTAAPESLRASLASEVAKIGELRTQMHAFHRGVEHLQHSGWNATTELAKAAAPPSTADRSGRAERLRRLRMQRSGPALPPEIKELLPKDAGIDWQRYAHRALTGQDAAVSLAYIDFLYAAALSGAGQFGRLANLEAKTPPPSSDAATFRDLTSALITDARIRTAKSSLDHLPELARQFSSPPAHRLAAALPTDTLNVAAARAKKEVVALEMIPEWERATKLHGPMQGFTATPRALDLYVRDGESMHLVRVDRASGRATIHFGDRAKAAFRQYCREQIRRYSRSGFQLANVLRVKGGYRILMSHRSIRLSNSEVAQLARGERLPPEHRLSQTLAADPTFVVYSHPLMTREGRYRTEAEHLAYAVQRSYPQARVFKDDLSDVTESRARAVSDFVIRDASDVVVLKAADSFRVDDANIINDIVDEFRRSGVTVHEVTEGGAPAPGGRPRLVIVISGHIDAQLAEFVRRAGEAGHFRNNIIAFNSCASELTSQLAHEMNTRYGAVATYRYEGKIPAAKVQEILLKVNDHIQQQQQPTLEDWKRFVLEEGLTGVWNICLLSAGEQHLG